MKPQIIALSLLASGGAGLAQEADPQLAFNNHCRTCHTTDEGDHRLGPSLHGILGREAGSAEGYGYSDALASADFVWDEAKLDEWIEDPDSVATGHKMKPYSGITDAELRNSIITALKTP